METHNIDSIIKKAINESESFYDSEATNAKERIWHRVQPKKQNQTKPHLFRWLVAASILLFIGLSILTISNIRYRSTINTLVALNHELKKESALNKKKSVLKESITANHVEIQDTIYIEKKVMAYKPLIVTKQITDTVYIQQIVYIEKEQNQALLTDKENSTPKDSVFQNMENIYNSEIIISNESLKREKRKKILMHFGGNKDQSNSGTLAFTTKL